MSVSPHSTKESRSQLSTDHDRTCDALPLGPRVYAHEFSEERSRGSEGEGSEEPAESAAEPCSPKFCPDGCGRHTPLHVSDVRDDWAWITAPHQPENPCGDKGLVGIRPDTGKAEGIDVNTCNNWQCGDCQSYRLQRYNHAMDRLIRESDGAYFHPVPRSHDESVSRVRDRSRDRARADSRDCNGYVTVNTAWGLYIIADESLSSTRSDAHPDTAIYLPHEPAYRKVRRLFVVRGLAVGDRFRPTSNGGRWQLPTQYRDKEDEPFYLASFPVGERSCEFQERYEQATATARARLREVGRHDREARAPIERELRRTAQRVRTEMQGEREDQAA